MQSHSRLPFPVRLLGSAGCLLAAGAVALSAYAAHAADALARVNLQTAALFAFGHGLALLVLPRVCRGLLSTLAAWLLLAGTLCFSGALVSRFALGVSLGKVAPVGGGLLILAWLLAALATLRR